MGKGWGVKVDGNALRVSGEGMVCCVCVCFVWGVFNHNKHWKDMKGVNGYVE